MGLAWGWVWAVARAQEPTSPPPPVAPAAPEPLRSPPDAAPGVDLAEEADIAFEIGLQHMRAGDYLQGLAHLLRSNRLAPNKNVLYNIAGAYEALGRFEQAYQAYTDYLGLETDAARRAEGDRALARLADRVALVEVTSDPPGATIYVDRRDLGARGQTPRTIALQPGAHAVILEADGYAPAQAQVAAVRGGRSTQATTLDRLVGRVRLFGEPAGAEVRLEGSDGVLGVLPATVSAPVGSTVLELSAPGYATRKVVVDVRVDEVAQLDGTLSLLVGRLVVDSPGRSGALVEVDGEAVAFTPAVVDVPVGSHTLRITSPGYQPFVETIEVVLGETLTIDRRLRGNVLDPLVVSASRTTELSSEAPAPVTVVTSDMIRAIGPCSLVDVLEVYVPGMTHVSDHNEINVAMRGVYASSQQKILVLVDGHRLNSRAYGMAAPDWSIALSPDRIRQIEVLRGPGSAVYGNIAFTAVVNVITNDGGDVGGLVARAGAGDHGQVLGSVVYGGSRTDDDDLVIWGQLYHAAGERFPIARADDYAVDGDGDGVVDPHAGYAVLGGALAPSPYDVGFRYEVAGLRLFADRRVSMHVEPFTSAGVTGAVYDYDHMRTLFEIGPGLSSTSNHLEAGYAREQGPHGVDVAAYFDTNAIAGNVGTAYLSHLLLAWTESSEGGVAQYTLDHELLGEGSVLVGGQLDVVQVNDALLLSGTDGDWQAVADTDDREVLLPGSESTYSAFVQLKQQFVPALILNLGGRFDYKVRRPGAPELDVPAQDDIGDFSPRLALVLRPFGGDRAGGASFSLKLSYAESFVDAPYWYRYNNLPSYAGAVTLTPEHLRAAQITPDLALLDGRFRATTNLAYQNVYDFIYRDNDADPEAREPFYVNAGRFDSLVAEQELAFVESTFRVRANATVQRVLAVENYDAPPDATRINNVPAVVGNLVLDVDPLFALEAGAPWSLWTNLTLRYSGRQAAPIRVVSLSRPDLAANLTNEEPGRLLVDVGARLEKFFAGFSVDARVTNLLDTRYNQGGSTLFPYPQPGRWFLANVEWAFDPRRSADGRR